MEKSMEKIVALAKARGFVYPGSEIYGGLADTWDYGNLGVELKNNVKRAWWQKFIQENPYNVGVDCAILMNPQTWVASGHLGGFSDPLMDCRECHERFRADKVIEDFAAENGIDLGGSVDGWSQEEMKKIVGMMCKDLVKRAKEQLDISLTIRDSVKKHIVETGTDQKYGARPLRRAVQNQLEDKLAEAVLTGEVLRGTEVVAGMSKKEIKFMPKTTK